MVASLNAINRPDYLVYVRDVDSEELYPIQLVAIGDKKVLVLYARKDDRK